ncbi:ligand-binding protein SH3 [Rhodospirillum rubrum]|uniref:DMT family transporter n=1 Tax=Rhodospirillum rubrum TaxID=1085 RepID=UPI0019045607|nr:multidrug efflux SMR transporter [Rhodospirillum rubrum]MBK1664532.1 ligand-binding protein SH3 [Rhodospirillum rubrum]MBK1676213.1 ligand-binding protein SH3 [Rhodospirillum rubrum]
MTWLILTGAILFELAGTTAMKLSEGFTRLLPSVALVVCYVISFALLTLTLKKMDVSIAYAIWSGAGTVLITVIGILVFKEPATLLKVLCIALIVAGVVGLNLLSKH